MVSDSYCESYHVWDEHGPPLSERECILLCVSRGAKFVLVVDEDVYAIENQDHPDLPRAAGHLVTVKGKITDGAIHVATVDLTGAR